MCFALRTMLEAGSAYSGQSFNTVHGKNVCFAAHGARWGKGASEMTRYISRTTDLPPHVLENHRRIGWTDEETIEKPDETIPFLTDL
jgi:hypothetical protein